MALYAASTPPLATHVLLLHNLGPLKSVNVPTSPPGFQSLQRKPLTKYMASRSAPSAYGILIGRETIPLLATVASSSD
jgi:hypothetical protein